MVLCTSLVDFVATIKTDLNFCKIPSFLTPIETEEINRDWNTILYYSLHRPAPLSTTLVSCLSPIDTLLNTLTVPGTVYQEDATRINVGRF